MVVVVVWSEATWIYGLPNRGSPDLDHTTSITWRKAPVLCRFVAHNTYTFLNEGPKSIPAQRLWTLGPTKKYYGWRRTSLSRPETLHFSIIIMAAAVIPFVRTTTFHISTKVGLVFSKFLRIAKTFFLYPSGTVPETINCLYLAVTLRRWWSSR
ncbi:hypothetical protein SCLCIDRAFT_1113150 [Scleroderma citrinum Foug A]|uniref:Uncharacterized protein n=1 Tax=Scleroderma citrinum Foug A TaxID=1036808 RepID=A0A0C3EIA5_9AGAM|nr:hypothetical protein SCLCIDRAFT_1113150 [Scleroderma citrinum Foug A]